MADPHDDQPDPANAHLRLQVALDQLLQPEHHQLDRDPADTRDLLRQANRDHLARIRDLTRRLRDANPTTARLIRADLQAAGERHRTRRAQLAARLRPTTAVLPPLLAQLHDAVTSATGAGNGARGPHRSPLNSTAVELLDDIRRTLGADRASPLYNELERWRPADLPAAADRAERWVLDARAIVTPARWTEAARPCPACRTRHVWVVEDGGRIRKAAIQVNLTDGYAACIAPACSAWWDRTRFSLLAAALEQEDVPAS